MGAFVISKRFNGQYKFVFSSRKGKTIFTSSGFDDKESCEEAIANLQEGINDESFVKFRSANGKYFFKISLSGELVATSRRYSTELMLLKGIAEILKYSRSAEILYFEEDLFLFDNNQ